MKVTVIIPNYNGKHFLKPCLDSLKKQTMQDFHTLVVDNASSDGSLDFMKEHFPEIEVLHLDQNYGFSAAVNAGIRHAQTPYVILLNNDTTVDPHFSPGSHRQRRRSLYAGRLGHLPRNRAANFQLYGSRRDLYRLCRSRNLSKKRIPPYRIF